MPPKKTAAADDNEMEEDLIKTNSIHDRMRFYGKVQDTPKEAQRPYNNGRFSGTDINPMWRIKKLTEVFGPVGFGWWTQNIKYNFVEAVETKETAVFCELELIVVDPDTNKESKPIYGVGGNTFVAQRKSGPQSSDEAMKMAYTDALSIACKALGFSHDIYFQADKTKYTVADVSNEPSEENVKAVIERIQKGIAYVSKNMSNEEKDNLTQNVIMKHIGNANYMACKDITKLNALKDELLEMAKKTA